MADAAAVGASTGVALALGSISVRTGGVSLEGAGGHLEDLSHSEVHQADGSDPVPREEVRARPRARDRDGNRPGPVPVRVVRVGVKVEGGG